MIDFIELNSFDEIEVTTERTKLHISLTGKTIRLVSATTFPGESSLVRLLVRYYDSDSKREVSEWLPTDVNVYHNEITTCHFNSNVKIETSNGVFMRLHRANVSTFKLNNCQCPAWSYAPPEIK